MKTNEIEVEAFNKKERKTFFRTHFVKIMKKSKQVKKYHRALQQ